MEAASPTTDHDLLIKLNENVVNLNVSVQNASIATSQTIQDHEHRLRELEAANSRQEGGLRNQKIVLTVVATVGTLIEGTMAVFMFLKH